MSKFDLKSIVEAVQKNYKKNPSIVGVGDNLKTMTKDNFIIMPEWWQQGTNTPGLPFGGIVQIAGDSDSGKTSAALEAMKAAQKQGFVVQYIETENKTTTQDLKNAGVDPSQVLLVRSSTAEHAADAMFKQQDELFKRYPEARMLTIFDSMGNIVSKRDLEIDLTTQNQKPGGKGAVNRLILNKLVARRDEGNIAFMIINYTYDNFGSPGKTNAGGKSLNFFSSLTYQTSRKAWIEREVKGVKVRKGAKVQWKLFKNHIDKANPGPKVIELDITSEGVKLVGASDDET